ncbi:MAG: adenosylcobinamide-GDP ribazoletransferase [Pseudomonadota bacterium]
MAPNETDSPRISRLWDLAAALVLLTRLPVPRLPDAAFSDPARAAWAYPLVGLVLGGAAGIVMALSAWLGLPALMSAGLTLATLIVLTGAMHEDGMADTTDGLWGGHDPARRLEIMKDSRIGAYGVLALILAMGLRWLGLAEVTVGGLVTALVLSRAMMPVVMRAPHARDTGLSHSVGRPRPDTVGIALIIGAVCATALAGSHGLAAMVTALGVALGIVALARAKIGGQTGDILGATQICCEITVLLTLIMLS